MKIKKDFLAIIGFFLLWRALIFALSIWGINLFGIQEFPDSGMRPLNYNYEEFDYGKELNSQSNWDGWQYISISQNDFEHEYQYAFFPLLPKLIGIFSDTFDLNPVATGIILANLFLLLAILYLYKLLSIDYGENVALKTIFLLLIFPGSFFFGMIYTESLFLLLSVLCFYCLRKEKFLPLFIFGFLIALTRNLGVLISLPLLYAYLNTHKKLKPSIIALGGPAIALGGWMTYLHYATGDFLKFISAQKLFFRETSANIFQNFWKNLVETIHYASFMNVLEILSVVLAISLIVLAMVKKEKKEYLIWSILLILPPLTQNLYDSINRYVIVIFPLFLYLAKYLKDRNLENAYYMISVAGLSLSIILFATFRWAG